MKRAVTALLAAGLLLTAGCQSGEPSALTEPSSHELPSSSSQAEPQPPALTLDGAPVEPGAVTRAESQGAAELPEAPSASAAVTQAGASPAFAFELPPEQTTLSLARDGETFFLGTLEEFAGYTPPANGDYTLDLWASWDGGDGEFQGLCGYRILLTYDLPITLSVDSTDVKQGYCTILRADYLPAGVDTVTAETDMGFTPTFYSYEGEMIALMPAKYSSETGEYHITLTAGEVSRDFTITVVDGGFDVTVQNFEIDQEVADSTVNNQQANIDYETVTRPLKNLGDPEKYWEGAFQLPIDPAYVAASSTFGRVRVINGVRDQHAGIDYPAPEGAQVYAPNNGRVLFAGYLQLTGNMICIEHGFGLKSWYYHLSAVEVEAGQMVQTGDPIGKVGSTGFVTGPHLHFTMSVNNIYTNPEQYLAGDPLG